MGLIVHVNPHGIEKGINPFTHGSAIHTDVMKAEGLKHALRKNGFDAAFGGARAVMRKSRAPRNASPTFAPPAVSVSLAAALLRTCYRRHPLPYPSPSRTAAFCNASSQVNGRAPRSAARARYNAS